MKKTLLTVALLSVAGTSAALASPRETFDVVALNGGNGLVANHTLAGDAGGSDPHNSVVNVTATGGYATRSVRVVGTVGSWGTNTYGSETTVRVTAPSGESIEFHPSGLAATPAGDVSFDQSLNFAPAATTGSWTVTTYETYDDASIDSTYSALSVTFDDAQVVLAPATFTDLGTIDDGETVSDNPTMAPGEVKWYRIVVAEASASAGRQVVITTEHSGGGDSELGLYGTDGILRNNVDDVVGLLARLSYGVLGDNGDLPAGTYYIALGAYNVTFSSPLTATSTSTGTPTFLLEVTSRNDFPADAGDTIETAMIPSGTGELTSIDGLFDTGADVDMYKINVCDPANFSASTVGGSTSDTQLFLFTESGMGVTSDDDTGTAQSTITNQFVTTAGTYYIAVNRYNIDPVDANNELLWANTPFNVERAPDGPAAANAFAGWTGAATGTGAYTLTFTGTCFPGGGTTLCSPADVGAAGGVAGHDRLLNNNDFIAFITLFFAQDVQADLGIAGGTPGHDNAWDNNDFIAFINYFFNDAAACNG